VGNVLLSLLAILLLAGVASAVVTSDVITEDTWYEGYPPVDAYARARPDVGGLQVVDRVLERILWDGDADEYIQVLVQFRSPVDDAKEGFLSSRGMVVIQDLHPFDGYFVEGRVDDLVRLSSVDDVYWMEANTPIEYHLDTTTELIHAKEAWYGQVGGSGGITGKGVTVAVVDSGIDGDHPDLEYGEGKKVIKNLKKDTSQGIWRERVNTDTSSGHGTHVAGTVAGDGQASAGRFAGVAPEASLIGLSMGEGGATIDEYNALLWVYENSRPDHNPFNIRVCANSWGPGDMDEAMDPMDLIAQVISKLTLENNVVVVFSAGNSGGDGSEVRTNIFGRVPVSISVAAIEHDGSGVASFSSRGERGLNESYPDVGAPGVKIMSAAGKRTMIGALSNHEDPYYLAISGTSMAQPHVAGLVALLFEAAPSLRMSEIRDDYNGTDPALADWWNDTDTRMHEAELILKLTTDRLELELNDPWYNDTGIFGLPNDYIQGYGMVNASKAVSLALALERSRALDPEVTVLDVIEDLGRTTAWRDVVAGIPSTQWSGEEVPYDFTNRHMMFQIGLDRGIGLTVETGVGSDLGSGVTTSWFGEWSRFDDQLDKGTMDQDLSHYLYIPANASTVEMSLVYSALDLEDSTMASVTYVVDDDNDGNPELVGDDTFETTGQRRGVVTNVGQKGGRTWRFDVQGQALQTGTIGSILNPDSQYNVARVDYTFSVTIRGSRRGPLDMSGAIGRDGIRSLEYDVLRDPGEGSSTMVGILSQEVWYRPEIVLEAPRELGLDLWGDTSWWVYVAFLLVVVILLSYANNKRKESLQLLEKTWSCTTETPEKGVNC